MKKAKLRKRIEKLERVVELLCERISHREMVAAMRTAEAEIAQGR